MWFIKKIVIIMIFKKQVVIFLSKKHIFISWFVYIFPVNNKASCRCKLRKKILLLLTCSNIADGQGRSVCQLKEIFQQQRTDEIKTRQTRESKNKHSGLPVLVLPEGSRQDKIHG